jgi:hypothetical protein
MQNMPMSRMERMEYKAKIRPPGGAEALVVHWLRYSRMVGSTALRQKLIGFPKYLQSTWAIEHLWEAPLYLMYRGARNILEMAVWYMKRSAKIVSQKAST